MPISGVLFATGRHDGCARMKKSAKRLMMVDDSVVDCNSKMPYWLWWMTVDGDDDDVVVRVCLIKWY